MLANQHGIESKIPPLGRTVFIFTFHATDKRFKTELKIYKDLPLLKTYDDTISLAFQLKSGWDSCKRK